MFRVGSDTVSRADGHQLGESAFHDLQRNLVLCCPIRSQRQPSPPLPSRERALSALPRANTGGEDGTRTKAPKPNPKVPA